MKQYKNKITGEVYTKAKSFGKEAVYILEKELSSRVVELSAIIPQKIVENSNDWQEVKVDMLITTEKVKEKIRNVQDHYRRLYYPHGNAVEWSIIHSALEYLSNQFD